MHRRLITPRAVLSVFLVLVLIALLNLSPALRDAPSIDRVLIEPLDEYNAVDGDDNDDPRPEIHPIITLISNAEEAWKATVDKQSKTLEEAVNEYRRRYINPPPPNFDRWYEFATARNSVLVDEYDMIFDMLTPFWALSSREIRARTVEALGARDRNALWGVQIRNGTIKFMAENGWDYLKDLVPEMTKNFIQWLPDIDLAFNLPDEPRVVVPHDALRQAVSTARMRAVSRSGDAPLNQFSNVNSSMLQDGFDTETVSRTRFYNLQSQPMWQASKLSCSLDSAARRLEQSSGDDTSEHTFGQLHFPCNQTSMTDICNSPSLASTHGFFVMTCGTRVTHDLLPVFSSSKMSSNQDIIFPAPWYWMAYNDYNGSADPDWNDKQETLFWRGSTTGGQSQGGSWRYQHRQRIVNALRLSAGDGVILVQSTNGTWIPEIVSRSVYEQHMDVGFTNIVQCDDEDCREQEAAFGLKEPRTREGGWTHRHLLDMDGNAFSGRFLTLLRSKSLVYKVGVFREWTYEWLWPWLHYIPLSFRFADGGDGDAGSPVGGMGSDWLETIRFFTTDPVGRKEAERLALLKREWVAKTMRKEDMEVWFFRLLLEYGRLIDPNREEGIGYSL